MESVVGNWGNLGSYVLSPSLASPPWFPMSLPPSHTPDQGSAPGPYFPNAVLFAQPFISSVTNLMENDLPSVFTWQLITSLLIINQSLRLDPGDAVTISTLFLQGGPDLMNLWLMASDSSASMPPPPCAVLMQFLVRRCEFSRKEH